MGNDQRGPQRVAVAGALGECVHVAGVLNFLTLAQQAGWRTVFLGPAVSIETLLSAAEAEGANLVGVSYRLTPETGERLLAEFAEAADELLAAGTKFAFGGTPPVASRARALAGFFDAVFDGGESSAEVLGYLRGESAERTPSGDAGDLLSRIRSRQPFPLLRHHFGLPDFEATREGITKIAESAVVDVISLGIDQDAQENFFHPERQDPRRRGAGGVPVRSADDYRRLYAASRCGNFPLMRTYSGTDDLIALAEMYVETIRNAWAAIPLFWFNAMDGRGPHPVQDSIREHQKLMSWYGERGIPVELNEVHHWGMRDAPDVICVAVAYLAAYNARAFGVRDYLAQLMFNSPPNLAGSMDLAKMLACLEIASPLEGPGFTIWRQTRTGLLSYPLDAERARGHLAASTYLQMALRPHVVHVVGHTEADHAASAADVIAACRVAGRAAENALHGAPDMTADPRVQARKQELLAEAQFTLAAIRSLAEAGVQDPLLDAATLSRAVACGILDAPHLRGNRYARGAIVTNLRADGAWVAADPVTRQPLTEAERLRSLGFP